MPLDDKLAEKIEAHDVIFRGDAVSEALQIEDILNRAHEIHHAHGGLFGYDLEDWLQAERELVERNAPDRFRVEERAHTESLVRDQELNWEKCFRLNN
jgi:DUF2934 family protein